MRLVLGPSQAKARRMLPLPRVMVLPLAVVSAFLTTATIDAATRPSILLLITDDQDVVIGGIDHMPKLNRLLVEEGTTFSNAFVHTPLCCPSRSSILTGRYIHNGGALNNSVSGNCDGTLWQEETEANTFGVYLSNAGYQTGFVGKYLNQYDARRRPPHLKIPPGWDRWTGLEGNSVYYNYELVRSDDHGQTYEFVQHGNNYSTDYLPNVIANETIRLIGNFSSASDEKPFLIVAAWPTPHAPFTPAPEYNHAFDGHRAHRTPNWNATDNSNKHWMMRRLGPIDPETEDWIDQTYQLRLETLVTIDDQIALFVNKLRQTGRLENSYIIFMSDNGFQLGQHRIRGDKRQLYEHDIRIPFVVRGPGVAKKVVNKHPVLNIDLAPTLVHIASGQQDLPTMDGRSFLPLLGNRKVEEWRTDFLVSYHGEGNPACGCIDCPCPPPEKYHGGDCLNNTYHCIRVLDAGIDGVSTGLEKELVNSVYCRFVDHDSFVEYYDLTTDPWQLKNAADKLGKSKQRHFEERLAELRKCHGHTCRRPTRSFVKGDIL